MDSMKRLYNKLIENNASKTTLCGCIIEKKKDKIIISRESRYNDSSHQRHPGEHKDQ